MKKGARFLTLLAVSLALVVPCFWQSRIQTQDLSSHVYNVWLAGEIAEKKPPNLEVVTQTTNMLFDVLLEKAIGLFGFRTGPKVLMAILVAAFFWSAFTFVRTVGKCQALVTGPMLAMLSYGWTYHMGFCNFYLATGLSFLYLALVWRKGTRITAAAVLVLLLAGAAHPFPAVWAAGTHVYRSVFERMAPRLRPLLLLAGLTGILVLRLLLASLLPVRWDRFQLFCLTGADQWAVFGWKYLAVLVGLLYLWGFLLYRESQRIGMAGRLNSPLLHVGLLTAAAIAILPNALKFPQHNAPFTFLTPRISLWLAVLLCSALPAVARPMRFFAASAALSALYFSFLYADSRALNAMEDRIASLVAQVPAGARVISTVAEPRSRIDPLLHMVDRACIGRCYSYANYEASSGHFRVRAHGPNPWVFFDFRDLAAFESGIYLLKQEDGVLYQIRACGSSGDDPCLRQLKPGDTAERTPIRVLPLLW